MSRPPLYLTPIGTNTTNEKIPHFEWAPVGTKTPDPKPLTLPTESSKRKEKALKEYILENLESDPSLLDSSPSESDFSDDSKYRKPKIKRRDKKENHQKFTKQDSSDSLSNDSDSSGRMII